MLFCPVCANSLVASPPGPEGLVFSCRTCTYVHRVATRIERCVPNLPKKSTVVDVMGGEEAWACADKTQIPCPKCNHSHAYFMQMQTRSADEPMTVFYRCEKCAAQWKEN